MDTHQPSTFLIPSVFSLPWTRSGAKQGPCHCRVGVMTTLHAAVLPARRGWHYFLSLTPRRRKPGPERADRLPEVPQWQLAQGQEPPDLRHLGFLCPSPWQNKEVLSSLFPESGYRADLLRTRFVDDEALPVPMIDAVTRDRHWPIWDSDPFYSPQMQPLTAWHPHTASDAQHRIRQEDTSAPSPSRNARYQIVNQRSKTAGSSGKEKAALARVVVKPRKEADYTGSGFHRPPPPCPAPPRSPISIDYSSGALTGCNAASPRPLPAVIYIVLLPESSTQGNQSML
ncbi:hypothetical protein MG293_006814 [Ovis ammon polii]|uniref:Uncharacterized protein n=1 Tax=Ovis ammon polii TaxID=230172 RepID=A0AAD4U936_OVIAM|nr:hypothetical protein MG293_006814 [Ovis ammon polii]